MASLAPPPLPGASLELHSSHRPGLTEEEICKGRAGVALPREILFFKGHCPHRKSLRGRPTCWAPLSHTPEANCDHTQQETHRISSASESLVVTLGDKFSMPHRHTKANAERQEKPHSTTTLQLTRMPFAAIPISLRFLVVYFILEFGGFVLFLDLCTLSGGKSETCKKTK